MTLAWQPNVEPDLAGRVFRRRNDGAWAKRSTGLLVTPPSPMRTWNARWTTTTLTAVNRTSQKAARALTGGSAWSLLPAVGRLQLASASPNPFLGRWPLR